MLQTMRSYPRDTRVISHYKTTTSPSPFTPDHLGVCLQCYLVDLRDSTPDQTVDMQLGPGVTINGRLFYNETTYEIGRAHV